MILYLGLPLFDAAVYFCWFLYLQVLREADMDGDGVMSYPEFERVITLNAAPDFMK